LTLFERDRQIPHATSDFTHIDSGKAQHHTFAREWRATVPAQRRHVEPAPSNNALEVSNIAFEVSNRTFT